MKPGPGRQFQSNYEDSSSFMYGVFIFGAGEQFMDASSIFAYALLFYPSAGNAIITFCGTRLHF